VESGGQTGMNLDSNTNAQSSFFEGVHSNKQTSKKCLWWGRKKECDAAIHLKLKIAISNS
jgi:hypothetical protein